MGHEAQRRAADPRQPPHRVLVPWVLRRLPGPARIELSFLTDARDPPAIRVAGFWIRLRHPKSRKFLPVSASCRNAMSVSTGAGFWLTIASIRHMSAQLVPDLPEECHPLRPVFLGLEPLRPLTVDDPEDASPPPGRGDDDGE